MSTYTEHEQRLLDQESGAAVDRAAQRSCEVSAPVKLSAGHKHILMLIRRDAREDGWTPVSKFVAPVFADKKIRGGAIPEQLCEFEALEEGGRARLTEAGNGLLDAMAWL